ncbi:MAG TPA: ferrous iron transport protein B [Bacteroidales bacterium]|nr:ferrous iron transport protein B [Bacteroidales bacterium]HPS16280.1 ferrous iron transport protein B [Bacteroidales bacterium]
MNRVDMILNHKLTGVVIFIIVIWLVFQATFGLGYYPMIWLTDFFYFLEDIFLKILPEGAIRSLLVNGILKGVGGVIVFLPNIVILFSLLSIMEESGYMARVTIVMDSLMRPFGLNGKSFISLVMGFGCNVPAIMTAEKIENKNSRLITILINPLMSCSSRFTVYVLLISAFFPKHPGTILFFIYLLSVILAIIISLILKKHFFRKTNESFETILTKLKIPSVKRILKYMWFNAKLFLKKITGAILIASVIIWLLSYFPNNADNKNIEKSYIGMIGKFIEPAIYPLGFDWRMGISLISGVAAKETIVGTLSELYQQQHHSGDDKRNLISSIKSQKYLSGKREDQNVFNPLVALSFMFFVSIYTPCIATIATIRKVTGSRKWTYFVIGYTTILAWVVSFLIYNVGSFFFG